MLSSRINNGQLEYVITTNEGTSICLSPSSLSLLHRELHEFRYEVLYGFNTKQLWVYDNKRDIYIDPPEEVLEDVEIFSDDIELQKNYLKVIISEEPSWLLDESNMYEIEV